MYGYGSHLVQWGRNIWINYQYPFDRSPMWNLVKIPQAVSVKTFKNYTILYMYIAQGQGQITPRGQKFDCNKVYYFNHTSKVSVILRERHFSIFPLQIWHWRNITKTYLYDFDPLKHHFYIVKLGFTEVYIIFLIFAQKHRLCMPQSMPL